MIVKGKITIWRQSAEIFESLIGLPKEKALSQLQTIENIPDTVRQRVCKLINAVDKKNNALEVVNSGTVFQQLKSITDLTGKSIDDYKITELIAIGGMSYMYKAYRIDSHIQKPVAIKVMSLNQSTQTLDMFNREQKTLSKLNHPNIVSFLHGGKTSDGIYYFVMEYLEKGIPLNQYIEKKNINVTTIVCMIKKIANAMKFAHENLIIHGDLKTDNILVDKDGNIKIVDFGISSFTYQDSTNNLSAYSPKTASPEQIKGEQLTTKTDVFSLASTLLQLLIKSDDFPVYKTGTYNESVDEKNVSEVLNQSSLDNDLCNILIKALRTDSFKRYFTMFDFAKDLHKWSINKPISATKNTKRYLLRKFVARNKSLTILGFAFTTLILVFATIF